jgi:hypothetical protein
MSIRGLMGRFHSEGVLSMNELMDAAEVGDFLALSPRTVIPLRCCRVHGREIAGEGGLRYSWAPRGAARVPAC